MSSQASKVASQASKVAKVEYHPVEVLFLESKGPVEISDDKRYLKLTDSNPGFAIGEVKMSDGQTAHQIQIQLSLTNMPAAMLGLTTQREWLTSAEQNTNTILVQTDTGVIYNGSKEPLEEKLEGCTKSSKLILQIDHERGKVSMKIDKNPPKVLCTGSDFILGKDPLYFVSGLFFKKDRLKIKNVDKLMEKIENKLESKVKEKMQEKMKGLDKLKINTVQQTKQSKADDDMVVDTVEEKAPSVTVDEAKTDEPALSEYTVNSKPAEAENDDANTINVDNDEKKKKKTKKPKPKPTKPGADSDDKSTKKSSNPLMGLVFGASAKTADDNEASDSEEERQRQYDNEFDALNEPSDDFYQLNTFDFFDMDGKMEYEENEEDRPKDGPQEMDGFFVDVVNTDQRDFVMFTDLMAELEELKGKCDQQKEAIANTKDSKEQAAAKKEKLEYDKKTQKGNFQLEIVKKLIKQQQSQIEEYTEDNEAIAAKNLVMQKKVYNKKGSKVGSSK